MMKKLYVWLLALAAVVTQQNCFANNSSAEVSYAGDVVDNPVPTPTDCQSLISGAGILHDQTSGDLYYLYSCHYKNPEEAILRLWKIRILDTKIPKFKEYPALILSEGVTPQIEDSTERLAIRSCAIKGDETSYAVVIGRYKDVPDDITSKDVLVAWKVQGDKFLATSVDSLGECPF
ncbi:MAG TPA: hypothetical protein VGE32_10365 [Cellvibrio sp.]